LIYIIILKEILKLKILKVLKRMIGNLMKIHNMRISYIIEYQNNFSSIYLYNKYRLRSYFLHKFKLQVIDEYCIGELIILISGLIGLIIVLISYYHND
jgi:hypothetical protein